MLEGSSTELPRKRPAGWPRGLAQPGSKQPKRPSGRQCPFSIGNGGFLVSREAFLELPPNNHPGKLCESCLHLHNYNGEDFRHLLNATMQKDTTNMPDGNICITSSTSALPLHFAFTIHREQVSTPRDLINSNAAASAACNVAAVGAISLPFTKLQSWATKSCITKVTGSL